MMVPQLQIKQRPIQILHVEDNPADVLWMRITLEDMGINCEISVVVDGEQAINFILRRGQFVDALKPDIIFLDMNLPKLTGVQVLEAIHGENTCPVCVVAGPRMEQDHLRTRFKLDARCCVSKPVTQEQILNAFDCFDDMKLITETFRSREQTSTGTSLRKYAAAS
jgi:chemotaxis family two-component system response regulator Rcp1